MTRSEREHTNKGIVKIVTPDTFQEDVIEASKTSPVLLEFGGPWCPDCNVLEENGIYERVARETGVTVAKVVISNDARFQAYFFKQPPEEAKKYNYVLPEKPLPEVNLVWQYNIDAYPTVMLMQNEQEKAFQMPDKKGRRGVKKARFTDSDLVTSDENKVRHVNEAGVAALIDSVKNSLPRKK